MFVEHHIGVQFPVSPPRFYYMQKFISLSSKNKRVVYEIIFDEDQITLEVTRQLRDDDGIEILAFYTDSLEDVVNKNYSEKESEKYYVALLNYIKEKLPEILI